MKPLSLILLLVSLSANSSDLSAPQVAIQKYFEYFNAKDIDSLNNASGQPCTLINGGKISKWNKYGDAVDFGGLESSGWTYSRIHQNELVCEDDMTAMVNINFSRYDSADAVISTSDVIYLLVYRDGAWKLKSGFVNGNLTLGK
tara:strand:+ start:68 stop:499 length:432 start_codon:yes stop_codon:yes gene_type:complete